MIHQVRELAEKFSHDELERCIDRQIGEGTNPCCLCSTAEETVNILSKASWVRKQIETGTSPSLTDALRKLAASMRRITQTGK
ncbi:MAG TPA: hypothetical protein ENN17_10060 [bacterium]|nr:hypothetical protein [bacterium]